MPQTNPLVRPPFARTTVRQGLPVATVDSILAAGDLTLAELDRLAFPRKTLAHRRTLGTLSPDQSDRLARILRLIAMANDMFTDRDIAHRWLRRPNAVLDDEAPLDLLDTDAGAREVETLLLRIGHGIAA